MRGLDGLAGEVFGPVSLLPEPELVAEFALAIGDDPARWSAAIPPLFANAALFAVAPRFLHDPRVAPYTRSLIHSEQRYTWEGPARSGRPLRVSGAVGSIRSRGDLNLVGFDITVDVDGAPWLSGSAQFLMSSEAAVTDAEEAEPAAAERPEVDGHIGPAPLPGAGEAIAPVRVGASRLDLVRYAAATRDWNPIHWDHDSAVAAGLPGVIVHGLLMAAWMGRVAARHAVGQHPLRSMALRFRRPLRPGVGAMIAGVVAAREGSEADLDMTVEASGEHLVTGRVRVTTG